MATGSPIEADKRTVPSSLVASACASASQATMVPISWIRVLVSRALVACERSWESLACRHGCREMFAFGGTMLVVEGVSTGRPLEEAVAIVASLRPCTLYSGQSAYGRQV